MIPDYILNIINKDNNFFTECERKDFFIPEYNPIEHYLDVAKNKYFHALLCLRSHIKLISDYYFSTVVGAKNIDLFMLTSSISSPMGPGSDSESIPIKFGELETYLTDSSQFGFESLLLNGLDKVYCYMPSMRGENPDKRHLNQFFHCEMEMKGNLNDLKPIIEGYIKILCETILAAKNIINLIAVDPERTKTVLKKVLQQDKFDDISFDEAVKILEVNKKSEFINYTDKGRDIKPQGERFLSQILKLDIPFWISGFDRDRVPFYQKPDAINFDKVINADMIFPAITDKSFGGEVLGSGQRQNTAKEMYESLQRQNLDSKPYEWYIDLRRQKDYSISSGFGLGIERFISWALGLEDIKDAIIYPRLKNVLSYP